MCVTAQQPCKGPFEKRKCKLKPKPENIKNYLCKGVAKCEFGVWQVKGTKSVWCKPQCDQNLLPELPKRNERSGKLSKWRRKKQAVVARQAFSFRTGLRNNIIAEILYC